MRLVTLYPWQETDKLVGFSDTGFAGCRVTRRSTRGGIAMVGQHCVKSWSTTQSVLTLSSGEAELVGLAKGVSYALGMKSLCKDLGVKVDVEVRADATAAIGMASRRGTGKVRHLDVSHLWIQERIRNGEVTLSKVPGKENPADAMTKYVDRASLEKHMKFITVFPEKGRAASAPMLVHKEEEEEADTKTCTEAKPTQRDKQKIGKPGSTQVGKNARKQRQ